ncbi:MAG: transglutaminase-like domain-containing protein [Dehalococcoidia bacterium]
MLSEFAAEVRVADERLRLDRAALLIATAEYPDLHVDEELGRLDALAVGVEHPGSGAPPRDLAAAVRRYLFDELGFRGNEGDYYDPRNSYLNVVITRRTGIPIALSVLFMEVARRAGLDAAGVGYPGHFLVKYRDGDQEWIVDPFHGGEEFPAEGVRAHLARRGEVDEGAIAYYLAAVTRRQTLTRMLINLKMIYLNGGDVARALRTQEYLLAVNPWSFDDIRDRGLLRARTGDRDGAVTDLETYLAHGAPGDDAATIAETLRRLRAGRGGVP